MFKMLIGISLMLLVTEMFLSGSSFKKYIRAAFGVFAFIIILEGAFSLEFNMDTSLIDDAKRLSDMTISKAEKELVDTYGESIRKMLTEKEFEVLNVRVICDGRLAVKKVIVELQDLSKKEAALTVMEEEFGLSKEYVEIKGEE